MIVHIGLPKAASTSLQDALASSRGALAAAGVSYPATGGAGTKDQRTVRAALSGDAAATIAVRSALTREDAPTVVLSGETMFRTSPAAVRAMLSDTPFADAALTFVAIVREPAGWLNSRYAYQAVCFGQRHGFARFVRDELPRTDIAAMFASWLGDGSFVALPLVDRRDGRPVVARAFAAMGLPVEPPPRDGRKPAPDPRTVETGRRVAQRIGSRAALREPAARRRLLDASEAAGWRDRFSGLDPALVHTINARTALSREAFARAVWGAAWDDVYAMPGPGAAVANEWRGGADASAIAALAQEVAAMLMPRGSRLSRLIARFA